MLIEEGNMDQVNAEYEQVGGKNNYDMLKYLPE